ncbi:hypothetical protein ACS0TY_032883 [Phlomoides rotata]
MGDIMRIYVGGLGSSVEEVDLKKTFTSPQLGAVQSVEIIRTKGRSFAYLEFLPASDKGLAKLFSTYNGCSWKGGRLKLEKAKEDYLARLRREWAEDTQIEGVNLNIDEDQSVQAAQKPKKDYDIEKLQLNIFFPKLRKIKPIPLKGTGKHKYSFQRVEVPPLPIHFCDCEEHSGPPEPPKRNYIDNNEMDNYGVNEDELNMMKSILSKFLEKETRSETVTTEGEVTKKKSNDASVADEWQVDDNEEDQVSDEDNLVINIVGASSKRIASFEDWGQKKPTADQNSLVREPGSFSNPTLGTEKGKHILQKKRKQPIPEDKSNDKVSSKKKGKKLDDVVVENSQPLNKESGTMGLSGNAKKSNKSAWKALVSEKGSIAFSVSDIVTSLNSEGKNKPRSDHLAIAPCPDENDGQQDQSSQHKEPEKLSDVQSMETSASVDKSGRGSSWLQKSSWLQLVGDANASAFNLAHILPEATLEKQELQQSHELRSIEQHGDQKSPVVEPQGRTITATPGSDVVREGKNDGGQLHCDSNPSVDVDMALYHRAVGDIVVSETCPFMKSNASMKEWMKSKAALNESHKKGKRI